MLPCYRGSMGRGAREQHQGARGGRASHRLHRRNGPRERAVAHCPARRASLSTVRCVIGPHVREPCGPRPERERETRLLRGAERRGAREQLGNHPPLRASRPAGGVVLRTKTGLRTKSERARAGSGSGLVKDVEVPLARVLPRRCQRRPGGKEPCAQRPRAEAAAPAAQGPRAAGWVRTGAPGFRRGRGPASEGKAAGPPQKGRPWASSRPGRRRGRSR